jgi:4-hydroxy-tetrahydrodipicolinate reductase
MGGSSLGLVLFGFGRVGRASLELAITRPWLEVRGIIARSPDSEAIPVATVVPGVAPDLRMSTDGEAVLERAAPDVVIVATRSTVADVLPQIQAAVSAGARAILCTAEELARPDRRDPAIRTLVDSLRRSDCRVVATGVNPGFVLDLWPLVLSGLAWDVQSLHAKRVVDVSVFAPHTRRRLGIGHRPDAFAAGVADLSIVGHLGFRESLAILCDTMGRPAEQITVDTEPIVAERHFQLPDGEVEPGCTVGATQRAEAWVDGSRWIRIELILHAAPAAAGLRTIDEAHLKGRNDLTVTLDPGCPAILSTAAQLINGIPRALAAEPGLYGPGDLPPSAPWLAASPPPKADRHATVVA